MQQIPYVLAIAGGTCGGKSTLADRLAGAVRKDLRTQVFHMDNYFKKEPPTTVAPITRKIYVEHNSPDSLELEQLYHDLAKAWAGGSSWELVIVEGLFALYLEPILERADLKVFVDLKSDERLVRRIEKHMASGQTFHQVTDRFLDTVRFRHDELVEPTRWRADMVVNGTLDQNQAVDILVTFLQAEIASRTLDPLRVTPREE